MLVRAVDFGAATGVGETVSAVDSDARRRAFAVAMIPVTQACDP